MSSVSNLRRSHSGRGIMSKGGREARQHKGRPHPPGARRQELVEAEQVQAERGQFSGPSLEKLHETFVSRPDLLRLELHVLVRRGVGVARNQPEPRLGHAGAVPVEEAQLPDRTDHRLVVHELLQLVEDGLPALGI